MANKKIEWPKVLEIKELSGRFTARFDNETRKWQLFDGNVAKGRRKNILSLIEFAESIVSPAASEAVPTTKATKKEKVA